MRKVVSLLYLGLKTLAYGGELLITRVNTFKSQQSKTYFRMIAGGNLNTAELTTTHLT